MAVATITTKGQVTIPKSVRDSLMLSTGDKIEFLITDKREALIRPISKKVDEISDHQQSRGYEEGPWKKPEPRSAGDR